MLINIHAGNVYCSNSTLSTRYGPSTWQDAVLHCQSMGLTLVTIPTEEKEDEIGSLLVFSVLDG